MALKQDFTPKKKGALEIPRTPHLIQERFVCQRNISSDFSVTHFGLRAILTNPLVPGDPQSKQRFLADERHDKGKNVSLALILLS